MSNDKCNCSLAISLVGDGCRYCQPQEYIDNLSEWLEEERQELAASQLREKQLREALESLMEWQVRNVKVWHNRAYDDAHDILALPSYTKALEIYALEQRIDELEQLADWFDDADKLTSRDRCYKVSKELRTKLAELKGGE